ncbi:sensor histidine kinase [Bacillus thuringiensis serovar mexicanensis]|uniref:histidine kinase n=2 Tax=Bacillus cereus group TaxID=86661 RepID=A0A242W5K3_BACTU|nr:sensor histidine kinase [Bacillus thuringiensis serovar mexicanensis]OTX03332.1 sensor histidine kinase [Bacillus thuringiensis serovar monterrey]OTX45117.1 sensor histidine kinase [Bacillus thuringiensis serovar pondicheriensis]
MKRIQKNRSLFKMFGESDIKLKIKSLQGIRAKFFIAFICSILLATISIIVFQILIGNIYSHVTTLEEKYSFLYFIVFLIFTTAYFACMTKTMMKRLSEINKNVKEISKGNFEVYIPISKHDEIGELATNVNRMAKSLKESVENEKKSQEMKNEMISNISHDLRTPVTSLIGYADLLGNKLHANGEECEQYVSILKRKSYELKNQVDELLEYCQINYREIELHKSVVNMKALMEQIMIDFVPQLDDANMSFCIKGDKELHVEIDVALMVRLFENVISNSIMYGKDGKEILILVSKRDMNVEIEVKNFGQCIPDENLPYVFEKFYRGEKSRSSHTGGKGMGLAIARSIAELHKGDITVRSNEKETIFTIALPQHKEL